MSYCRLTSDSDVYMWSNSAGFFVRLPGDKLLYGKQEFKFEDLSTAYVFLLGLECKGYRVPRYAFERIWEELGEL